jgi:hypothetical protein
MAEQIERYNDGAKRMLTDYVKRQKRVEDLTDRLDKANMSVNTLKEKQIDLDAKIEDLRSRKDQLKSEWRMAKAEENISSSLAGFENDFSDMDFTLGRIEEKIKRKKALAEASTEVIAEQQLASDPLDLSLPELDAEAALAELDRELKGDPALPGSDISYFCISISGGGTWAIDEQERNAITTQLNDIDNELTQLNESGQLTSENFDPLFGEMYSLIRQKGKLVGRDLTVEDAGSAYPNPEIKLPPEDLEYDEAGQIFAGEGLFPG